LGSTQTLGVTVDRNGGLVVFRLKTARGAFGDFIPLLVA